MEVAKLHAAESAANFKEVLKREKKTLTKFQSWEKQKALIQEELRCEKAKLRKLLQEVERAKNHKNQVEARLRQEETAKEDLLARGKFNPKREGRARGLCQIQGKHVQARSRQHLSLLQRRHPKA
ncbi:hypothetical protein SAY87_012491 [Trapa incisa]|uniref:Uncharacterized protein n=1 Tax=Trapa incisa TaxID=236973 RepID=A0AAN7GQA9_9MYRT|nr:hypothetical protein SAY87_012491 [Trapa incisa]